MQGTVIGQASSFDTHPVVLLHHGDTSTNSILSQLRAFERADDVYSSGFSKQLVLAASETTIEASKAFLANLKDFDQVFPSLSEELPAGPYFLCGQNLHQAWRLYEDDLDSFIFAVLPDDVQAPDR